MNTDCWHWPGGAPTCSSRGTRSTLDLPTHVHNQQLGNFAMILYGFLGFYHNIELVNQTPDPTPEGVLSHKTRVSRPLIVLIFGNTN